MAFLLTMAENNVGEARRGLEDKGSWCTNGGDKHDWKQWHEYVKHCRKYRCKRVDSSRSAGSSVRT